MLGCGAGNGLQEEYWELPKQENSLCKGPKPGTFHLDPREKPSLSVCAVEV